jgi:hypothetical protein
MIHGDMNSATVAYRRNARRRAGFRLGYDRRAAASATDAAIVRPLSS